MKVSRFWVENLSKADKVSYVGFLRSLRELQSLKSHLQELLQGIRQERLKTDLKVDRWEYAEAERLGKEKAIQMIIDMVTFEE